MKSLVQKEIRLLLPAYAVALALAVIPVWLLPPEAFGNTPPGFIVYPFWLGAMMLALCSFGREFSMRTFPLLLAQPWERRRIWWIKIAVLAGAMATALAALHLSLATWIYASSKGNLSVRLYDWSWGETLILGGTGAALAFAGGLWTTLWLRQVAAAFWFAILAPGAILIFLDSIHASEFTVQVVLVLYSLAGFWLAWRLFLRAQETAWTGGVVALPGWGGAEAAPGVARRARSPVAALCWKELQLHQIGLAGMGGLFLLHLGVVVVRKLGLNAPSNTLGIILDHFGGLWLLVPLLAGGSSVAEERKLGTMEGHLCLPVSTRVQFVIKLLFVLGIGGWLSVVLLGTAEGIGGALGAGRHLGGITLDEPILWFVFEGLALISFYASTLTRTFLQALATAVVIAMASSFLLRMMISWQSIGTFQLWGYGLGLFFFWPILMISFTWLAYRNYRCLPEGGRLWRRNFLGLGFALVTIVGATTAVYHRAWELVLPLEPPHGLAQLGATQRATIRSSGGNSLAIVLPEGRIWANRFLFQKEPFFQSLSKLNILPESRLRLFDGGNPVISGSNWVDVVLYALEIIALHANGTLWGSEELMEQWNERMQWLNPAPFQLVRFGNETNWQSLVAGHNNRSVLLLKQDGTLWRWGTNYHDKTAWFGLRDFSPQRLGTESDWARLMRASGHSGQDDIYAWKKDGRAWVIYPYTPMRKDDARELEPEVWIEPVPGFDHFHWRSLAQGYQYLIGVREDGTLWINHQKAARNTTRGKFFASNLAQFGNDTNWLAVAGDFWNPVALKADGTLWKWPLNPNFRNETSPATRSPVRLGRHHDWLAVGYMPGGSVSLAADGSLWYWSGERSSHPMLAPSRKPDRIGSISLEERP